MSTGSLLIDTPTARQRAAVKEVARRAGRLPHGFGEIILTEEGFWISGETKPLGKEALKKSHVVPWEIFERANLCVLQEAIRVVFDELDRASRGNIR